MEPVSGFWSEDRKTHGRLGAAVALTSEGPRLIIPRGFLRRWHQAALPTPAESDGTLPSLPELERTLRDPRAAVRWRIVERLRRAGPPAGALPFLLERLRCDPCRSVRWRAAEALSSPPFPAAVVAKALIEASSDRDEWVRWHSHRVLTQVIDSEAVLALLPQYIAEATFPATRAYAVAYLAAQETLPPALLGELAKRLWDEDVIVRQSAVEVFIRHPLPPGRRAALGLRLCLEDAEPRLRERAVRAFARLPKGSRTLLQSALADPSPMVRTAVCAALSGERTSKRWLRHALDDPDVTVRVSAAKALVDRDFVDRRVVETLRRAIIAIPPQSALDVWRALIGATIKCERDVLSAIAVTPAPTLHGVIAEDVADGVFLPTIGLRLWAADADIRYPNKEGGDRPPIALGYPWADVGVHRSWETHHPPHGSPVPGIVKQVCLAAVPFPYAHLVAAVEFSRYIPDRFDGSRPPVHIEGRPVASILEGGNATPYLQRLDFVFANDLRFCQYATFGGLSGAKDAPTPFQQTIVAEWRRFCERLSEILTEAGLTDFLQISWFDTAGWQSSRYGRRHERDYADIRDGLTRLLRVLRSARGRTLRERLGRVAAAYADAVELAVWTHAIGRYPNPVLRLLVSGAAGSRIARYAECAVS